MVNVSFDYGDTDEDMRVVLNTWGGVQIRQPTIEGWIRECIRELESEPEQQRSTVQSGDSLVIVERSEDAGEGDEYPYDITVCTIRQHGYAKRM